ncbi:MAG: carbohydrate porin [Alphaproteobacteria bacterium]|nr:carbohydrate porin [Alphaproteobacteria bacterium]
MRLLTEFSRPIFALALTLVVVPALALSQTTDSKSGNESRQDSTKELHGGILPPVDYTGDLTSRAFLLGDWGSVRSDLSDKGVRFRGWLTPNLQRVTSGGSEDDTAFGASGDLWAALDFHKMDVIPGGLLTVRAEFDVGKSVSKSAGTILPPSYNAILPIAGETDRDSLSITSLYYTQFFGKKFGAWLGRSDTHHNANLGEFAGLNPQVGNTQFQHLALTAIPVMPISQPYVSSLGAGVFARPTKDLSLAAMVMDSRESSQRSGFDEFGKDWNSFFAVNLQHRLGDLPGGQLVGYSYSWNGDYTKLENSQLQNLISGTPLKSESETWAAIYSAWQYLQVFEGDTSKSVRLNDGRADHRGWGVFLMAGLADQDTNPVQWSIAGGVGGRGLMASRPNDSFGIGYFIIEVKDGVVANLIGLKNTEQGVEIYYEAELTPWFHVTPDLQIVDPGLSASDTAVIVGLRANISF